MLQDVSVALARVSAPRGWLETQHEDGFLPWFSYCQRVKLRERSTNEPGNNLLFLSEKQKTPSGPGSCSSWSAFQIAEPGHGQLHPGILAALAYKASHSRSGVDALEFSSPSRT
jgi:hypothetical protein